LVGELHGGVSKAASGIGTSNDAGTRRTDEDDLAPEPCHVARSENAERENDAGKIT
jgi:hypothetical protein